MKNCHDGDCRKCYQCKENVKWLRQAYWAEIEHYDGKDFAWDIEELYGR